MCLALELLAVARAVVRASISPLLASVRPLVSGWMFSPTISGEVRKASFLASLYLLALIFFRA
jgi:hypothetical protein